MFHTAPEFRELVPSSCIMLYVHGNHIIIWLIGDGVRMDWAVRTQAHLPVQFIRDWEEWDGVCSPQSPPPCLHSTPALQEVEVIFFRGASRAHKPYITRLIRDGRRMEWRGAGIAQWLEHWTRD